MPVIYRAVIREDGSYPPVVACALGYSPGTATCHVIAAGGTWHRYPATRAGS